MPRLTKWTEVNLTVPEAVRKVRRAEFSHELQQPTDHNYMSRQNNHCNSLKIENQKAVSRIWTNMLFGGKTQCAVLGLHQDAQVTTVIKQKKKVGGKSGLQINKHVFLKCYSPGEKVSREQWGRTVSLHRSGCFVSLTVTNSKVYKSKLQWRCTLAWAVQPAQPPSTQLSQHMAARWSAWTLLFKYPQREQWLTTPRNLYGSFTSQIIQLTASACQFFVYNTGATKHEGN